MPGQTVYICGKVRDEAEHWEFFGVFTNEEDALALCTTPQHFVGPVILNQPLDDEPQVWPGAVFPIEG
jgi:hypothetical protein